MKLAIKVYKMLSFSIFMGREHGQNVIQGRCMGKEKICMAMYGLYGNKLPYTHSIKQYKSLYEPGQKKGVMEGWGQVCYPLGTVENVTVLSIFSLTSKIELTPFNLQSLCMNISSKISKSLMQRIAMLLKNCIFLNEIRMNIYS